VKRKLTSTPSVEFENILNKKYTLKSADVVRELDPEWRN